jgi:rhodanese-related sulfurtransferase
LLDVVERRKAGIVLKRALSYGYTNVAWYPEGTDGWQRANLPLADRSQIAAR